MKINTSSKLLITSLAIVFFSILLGLVANLLTSDPDFGKWLKDWHIGMRELIIGVVILGMGSLIFTYFQFRYSQQTEQTSEKENSPKDIESDVKRYYDSLRERYKKRYESKLDGRFEITLEVSENWDSENTKNFKGEYEGKGQISEAFEYINSSFEKHGRLLIVGSPGVGKTVLLLKLALELLENADIENKEAFPVIFNLASWSDEYENFDDWLISVLNSGEGLSEDFARKLLQEERIIILLDGLDELARSAPEKIATKVRAYCLHTLNDYLDREKKSVICCRVNEFEMLRSETSQDAPVSAKIMVNDLTEAEVLNNLMKVKENKSDKVAAENLLNILEKDENNHFLKVLTTPFYFTTALEVFDKQIFEKVNLSNDADELKNYLRRNFIEKKLNITPNLNEFNVEKTKKWLKFLAGLIDREKLVIFELNDLHSFDLTGRIKFSIIFGVCIGAVFGLFTGLIVGLLYDSVFGLVSGLSCSLLLGFAFGLVFRRKVQTEDIISLDFSNLLDLRFWLFILFVGLYMALIFIGIDGLFTGLSVSLFTTLYSGLFLSFEKIKRVEEFSRLENSYQRIKGSSLINWYSSLLLSIFFSAGIFFLSFYIPSEILYNVLIPLAVISWLICLVDLFIMPYSQHSILRFCLYLEDKMPLKYAAFLDYAAEARILEKDGGHWRFRHQNLQDYFAGLDEQAESPVSS